MFAKLQRQPKFKFFYRLSKREFYEFKGRRPIYFNLKMASTSKESSEGQFINLESLWDTEEGEQISYIDLIQTQRLAQAPSILKFRFLNERCRVLSVEENVKENSKGILYWMFRDQRVEDNWALLYAQKLAFKNKVPLHVCFVLLPKFLDANMRHYRFLVSGLKEVEHDLKQLNIGFHLLFGDSPQEILKFVTRNNIGGLVCDFSPLRLPMQWVDIVKTHLPSNIPFVQVDAHNVVPVWFASPKQEYTARTIRNKINDKLCDYLSDYPPVLVHEYDPIIKATPIDWNVIWKHVEVEELPDCPWAVPGYRGGMKQLEHFCRKNLKLYDIHRNNPNYDVVSNLSPWLHFGQIAPQRAAIQAHYAIRRYKTAVDVFKEEVIVRRELAENFCFYNQSYDSIDGMPTWAKLTLNKHKKDKREYVYCLEAFEQAQTHDDLWNSAQIQLNTEGKMHGFMRMYWAKKILEWTASPEIALKFAIYLNDKYSLDGRDPNGYVGCMWSIGGVHDQGWRERQIFGKIRYMNYDGCKRKFDIAEYIGRYGGKAYAPSTSAQ